MGISPFKFYLLKMFKVRKPGKKSNQLSKIMGLRPSRTLAKINHPYFRRPLVWTFICFQDLGFICVQDCWGQAYSHCQHQHTYLGMTAMKHPNTFHRIGPLGRFDPVVAMSVCLCVCLCVCVFDVPFHVVYFESYLAPIFQSRMSKICRDSESLGKSAGKKWSQN